MNFLETMTQYFLGERLEAIIVAAVGAFMLGLTYVCYRVGLPDSIARGLTIPLLLFSLILIGAGVGTAWVNNQRLQTMPAAFSTDSQSVLQQEALRMEKATIGLKRMQIVWTLFLVAGIVVLFVVPKYYWMGVALGLLIFGVSGHIIDGLAIERNMPYQAAVVNARAGLK